MLFERLLKKCKSEETEVLTKYSEEESDFIIQYKKDMRLLKFFEESKDFNWVQTNEKMPKIFLINPAECANNQEFNLTALAKKFQGMGKTEWEIAIAALLMKSVYEWKMNQSLIMADITTVFNRDYFTNNHKKQLSHENILIKLDPWIKVVEATSEEVYLKLNV